MPPLRQYTSSSLQSRRQVPEQPRDNVRQPQTSSPERFYDAITGVSPVTPPSDLLDTSSDPENEDEDVFDGGPQPQSRHAPNSAFAYSSDDFISPASSDPEDELTTGRRISLSESSATNRISVVVDATILEFPRSRYAGYNPPLPICQERTAVQELCQRIARESNTVVSDDDDHTEFELTDFAIYLPKAHPFHACELRGLQDFASKAGHSCMFFDGILSAGSEQRYVEAVPFEICSIGNYGEKNHAVAANIWIKSAFNKNSDVFYRLKTPSPEYRRFHRDFLWLANLAKHFVDYCEACELKQKPVSIHNFRQEFSQWACNLHQDSKEFQLWWNAYGDHDFRRAIAFNINFLFKESIGVKNNKLRKQPIWSEVLEKDCLPFQKLEQIQTIVTPYVYDCFKHLRFGHHLKSVVPTKAAHERRASQGKALHLTLDVPAVPNRLVVEVPTLSRPKMGDGLQRPASRVAVEIPVVQDPVIKRRERIEAIKRGDVLSVPKDSEGSIWKDEASRWKAADDCWYVYVQDIHVSKKGNRSFDAIWLYKPSDTSCAKMKYPFPNELFLSDNCTCGHKRIKEDEVIDVLSVTWNGQPSEANPGHFIRQTYLENDRFVTFKEAHKTCEHLQKSKEGAAFSRPKYAVGQTVLVPPASLIPRHTSKYGLEPFQIVAYDFTDSKQYAILRRLLRRNEIDKQHSSSPNELLYTNEMAKIEARKIERTCLVRFYSDTDVMNKSLSPPYNRNGTGNVFYITSKLSECDTKLMPITAKDAPSLIQGFDPLQATRGKLRGLDLYCGGGNFGRGLEEGGALHNEWAVDMDKVAIHTYFANLDHPQDTKLFYGSVNDQLYQAMHGNTSNSNLIPRPGEVDFISAGSPCQGYSNLNINQNNEKGTKNQSLVASVAAYIDFYRPKYGLLENVLTMARKGKGRDQDVLSQLICTIVGMGYQLSTFMLDAWSCGSPQGRSRIFVAFTAPGYNPMLHPELSHSHPSHVLSRGLGQLANGEAFGERKRGPTPFNFVTASLAVNDLPNIGDGRTYSCISHPDHVMPAAMSSETKLQIQAIPTFPRGMNFWEAWKDGEGVMSKAERALFPSAMSKSGKPILRVLKGSKAWGRINPHLLFGTIVSAFRIQDIRMGRVIHWDQQRTLTVMEARRAQSFPDHEVILGPTSAQQKIIGNSVDRCVSLALGLSLREAWEMNLLDDGIDAITDVVRDVSLISTNQALFTTMSRAQASGTCLEESKAETEPGDQEVLPTKASRATIRDSRIRNVGKMLREEIQDKSEPSTPERKIIFNRSARTIKDSNDSTDNEIASDYCLWSQVASQPTSLKRPYAVREQKNLQSEKVYKAAKVSAAGSPSSAIVLESNGLTTIARETILLQQFRRRPINTTHTGRKVYRNLDQKVGDKSDNFAIGNEPVEIDSSGYVTLDDDDDVGKKNTRIPRPPSETVRRKIGPSNLGRGNPPTSARSTNMVFIDLTSTDDEHEGLPSVSTSTVAVKPALQAQQKHISAAEREKQNPVNGTRAAGFTPAYAARGNEQLRKHGPTDR